MNSAQDHFIRKLEAYCDDLQAQIEAAGKKTVILNPNLKVQRLTERYNKLMAILERHRSDV